MGLASRDQVFGVLIVDGNYQSSLRRLGGDRAGKVAGQSAADRRETAEVRFQGYP